MTWQVHLIDADGFVIDNPEEVLPLIEDPDAIQRQYGDCIPDEIIVSRGTALPRPQSPGSEHLRAPGSYKTGDRVGFDVADPEDPTAEYAALLWRGAHGFAAALNGAAGAKAPRAGWTRLVESTAPSDAPPDPS